ncbi:MAG: hypothetical protein ACI3YH_07980 [Eubacteriales bacterium]
MTKTKIFALLLAGVALAVAVVKICQTIKNKNEKSDPIFNLQSDEIGFDPAGSI